MVRVRGVDHRIGPTCLFSENKGVIQGAEHWGDTQGLQGTALLRVAQQAPDFMTRIHQVFGHGAADVAGHAGNENLQCLVLVAYVIAALCRAAGGYSSFRNASPYDWPRI
ncbi:hypothetical protein D3C76_1281900 [compost metagenome]